jgi:hypothetical protein
MKKIFSLCALLVLLSVAASAQTRNSNIRRARPRVQVTRPERLELRKDVFRYEALQRRSHRDGVVTPLERRRLHKEKRETRTDRFRYRHNGRRRLI